MSVFNFTGFETGDLSESITSTTTSGTLVLSTTEKRSGNYALVASTSSGTGKAVTFLGAAAQNYNGTYDLTIANDLFTRFYLKFKTLPFSNYATFLTFFANQSGSYVPTYQLAINNAGFIYLYKYGSLVASGSTAVTLDSFYRIETKISGSGFELLLNGAVELTYANTGIISARIGFGKATDEDAGQGISFVYDDIIITNDRYPGPGKNLLLLPSGITSSGYDWTPSSGTLANSYQLINEVPPDDDASYLTNNSTTVSTGLTVSNSSSIGVNSDSTINSIKLLGVAMTTIDGGTKASMEIIEGGVNSSPILLPSSTYLTNGFVYDRALSTSQPWTSTTLDSASYALNAPNTSNYRVTAFYVSVDFNNDRGVIANGTAEVLTTLTVTGSSGVLIDGAATLLPVENFTGSGGVFVYGDAVVTSYQNFFGQNGVLAGGTGAVGHITFDVGSSGVLIAGNGIDGIIDVSSGGVLVAGSADVLSTIATGGGVLVAGSELDNLISFNTGTGGVLVSGTVSHVDYNLIVGSGGVLVAGAATFGSSQTEIGSSGVLGGGNALLTLDSILATGGVLLDGAGDVKNLINTSTSGGVVVDGSANSNIIYGNIDGSGSVLIDGTAPNDQVIVGSGGATLNGDSISLANYSITSVGGVKVGGEANHTLFIYFLDLGGGVKVGGSSIAERFKNLLRTHHKYALCMKTDNIVIDAQATKLEKEKIMVNPLSEEAAPSMVPVYVYPHIVGYCDFDIKCSGVLPKVIDNRQKGYLPPQKITKANQ